MALPYKRILIKLSGEAFLGDKQYGIDPSFLETVAKEVAQVHKQGVELAIVVGGGNFFRGNLSELYGLDRVTGDYVGMLASVMNALIIQEALQRNGAPAVVQSAIEVPGIAEPFVRKRAIRHMEKGRIIVFAAGTGQPFFTHDMAGVLRALETNCQVVFKGTKVDGVYSADPEKDPAAKKFDHLSYREAIDNQDIAVMDKSALTLCQENNLPIVVFQLTKPGNLIKVSTGEKIGTIIS